MRRPSGSGDEKLGQHLRTGGEAAGWTAGELAEVPDQVRLIEISALDCNPGPTPWRHGGIEPCHESLESGDPRQSLRSDTHLTLEASLELPPAQPESGGQSADRDAAVRGSDRSGGGDNATVRIGP